MEIPYLRFLPTDLIENFIHAAAVQLLELFEILRVLKFKAPAADCAFCTSMIPREARKFGAPSGI